ncbi:hypothetical protein CEXT_74231 [Caerostris extrusa]|uniref:Uncharacterized protein n=1 Tax=Caerostris extrusa TaxID=172846 RepID=A0AAV4UX20_CAEEX|nr:hypothetical protein CEXT_74231 [Caerostris extrusa]
MFYHISSPPLNTLLSHKPLTYKSVIANRSLRKPCNPQLPYGNGSHQFPFYFASCIPNHERLFTISRLQNGPSENHQLRSTCLVEMAPSAPGPSSPVAR